MARDVEHGTLLGKCVVDGQPIYEGLVQGGDLRLDIFMILEQALK